MTELHVVREHIKHGWLNIQPSGSTSTNEVLDILNNIWECSLKYKRMMGFTPTVVVMPQKDFRLLSKFENLQNIGVELFKGPEQENKIFGMKVAFCSGEDETFVALGQV